MTTKKASVDWRVMMTGIAALTIIEIVALCNGINGSLMTIVLMIIAASIGVSIPKEKIYKD